MSGVRQDRRAWEMGWHAGRALEPLQAPQGVDRLSWVSGYIEGKAARSWGRQRGQERDSGEAISRTHRDAGKPGPSRV